MYSNPVPPGFIVMSQWNIVIIEFDDGEIIEKFLGLDTSTGRYRISSQILAYDAERDTGRTLSGSNYQFLDKPGRLHVSAQEVYDALFAYEHIKVSLKFPVHYDA